MSSSNLLTKTTLYTINGVNFTIRSLLDKNQFHDPEGEAERLGISSATWPLFGVVWPSGLLLADIMSRQEINDMKILELGCGLGLASLVVHARGGNVLATDYHPMAAAFMQENSQHNGLSPTPFQRCDWAEENLALGKFDLIIGSDLLYEPNHPHLLSQFINQHSTATTQIIIVDPKRRLQNKFRNFMEALGYQSETEQGTVKQLEEFGFKGMLFRFSKI
jgi:predicted nicotinamide N-methyase